MRCVKKGAAMMGAREMVDMEEDERELITYNQNKAIISEK